MEEAVINDLQTSLMRITEDRDRLRAQLALAEKWRDNYKLAWERATGQAVLGDDDIVVVPRINTNGSDVPDYQLMWQDQVKQNKHILADRDRWKNVAELAMQARFDDCWSHVEEAYEQAVRGE